MDGTPRAPRSAMETNDIIRNRETYAIDGATLNDGTLDEDSINAADGLEMTDDDGTSPIFPEFGVSFPNYRPNSSWHKLCDAQLDNDEKKDFSNQRLNQYFQKNQSLVSQQNRKMYQWKEDQHFMPYDTNQSTTFQPGTAFPKLSNFLRPDKDECVEMPQHFSTPIDKTGDLQQSIQSVSKAMTKTAHNFITRPNFGTSKFATYGNLSLESNSNNVTYNGSILPNDSILQACIYKSEENREKLLMPDETCFNMRQATTSSMKEEICQEDSNFRQRIKSLQVKHNTLKEKLLKNQRQRSGEREKLRYARAHSVPLLFGSRDSYRQRRLSLPQTLRQGLVAGSHFLDQEYDTKDSEFRKPSHMESFHNLCLSQELQETVPLTTTINNLIGERKDTAEEAQYYSMIPGPNVRNMGFRKEIQSFGDESFPHKISVLAPATFSASHERASTDTISNMKYLPVLDAEPAEIQQIKKQVSEIRISKTFPAALMQEFQKQANEEAIAWLPDGLSFVIVSKERLLKDILPSPGLSQPKLSNNKDMKYESFIRKLHRWGFTRLAAGTGLDCFYHPKFVRDCPILVTSMEPAKKVSSQNQDDEKFNGGSRPSLAGIDTFKVQRTNDVRHGIPGVNKISVEDGSNS